jgi:gallate decarboxylase subunit C
VCASATPEVPEASEAPEVPVCPSMSQITPPPNRWGITPIEVDIPLDPRFEVADHYLKNFATNPANTKSGAEPCVLYTQVKGGMPVLMGLFGDRVRCRELLGFSGNSLASWLSASLSRRLETCLVQVAPVHALQCPEKLDALPILTFTPFDAGPYITSGLVCVKDPVTERLNVSIHRMRVIGNDHLTIYMAPGRDLHRIHQMALASGVPLEISINIGVSAQVYLASSISDPLFPRGESELDWAGAIQGEPVKMAKCLSHRGVCIADSEIVIEGILGSETAPESHRQDYMWAMPEFLGYMGTAQSSLPLVEVTSVFHRKDAVYQTFFGPGKEQSELLAIPTEAGLFALLSRRFLNDFLVHDIRYMTAGGGQLIAVIQIEKFRDHPNLTREILDSVCELHGLTKGVMLVDDDVDLNSDEELFWAIATRFQPSLDLVVKNSQHGFAFDPSQSSDYWQSKNGPVTDKYLFDLTVPLRSRDRFRRFTNF